MFPIIYTMLQRAILKLSMHLTRIFEVDAMHSRHVCIREAASIVMQEWRRFDSLYLN